MIWRDMFLKLCYTASWNVIRLIADKCVICWVLKSTRIKVTNEYYKHYDKPGLRENYSLRNIYMLFAGWEVRMVKNCDRGLENTAQGPSSRSCDSKRNLSHVFYLSFGSFKTLECRRFTCDCSSIHETWKSPEVILQFCESFSKRDFTRNYISSTSVKLRFTTIKARETRKLFRDSEPLV